MARFLVKRILHGLLVLFLITIGVFAIFFVAPNNVARTLAGRQATPQTVKLIQERLGLDQPVWKQYLDFLWKALHGNLGFDYYHQVPVTQIIGDALPATIGLAVGAAVIWMLLGVFNGVVAAVRPRSIADRGMTGFALFFYSMPTFLLGLLLLYFLYFQLDSVGFPDLPGGRLRTDHGEPARLGASPGAPLAHVGAGPRRDVHPVDPWVDAGRAR